jgi:hypothetical protein
MSVQMPRDLRLLTLRASLVEKPDDAGALEDIAFLIESDAPANAFSSKSGA